jgi:NAD(P)-dependent dehydrogenase (short-subunit alcohol dehydrogenase family)
METASEGVLSRLFDVRTARVVVTGAASGIGFAMAEVLADCGARVTLADVDAQGVEAAASQLADRGRRARHAVVDVTDEQAVRSLVEGVAAELGGLDVVFANAGISTGPGVTEPGGQLGTVDRDAWECVLAVNLHGVFYTMPAAASVMRPQRSGRIIVTASVAGLRAEPVVEYAYVASKAAVVNMVRQAALDLAPHGVLVNAIAPGPFVTRIGDGTLPDNPELRASWGRLIPLGRMAATDEMKGLIVLLASPASSFMTGAVYPIDGGALALAHAG